MEGNLKSMKKECLKKILDQINNSICIIKTKDGKEELGLFCNIKYKNKIIPVLLINNYINDKDYQTKIKISFIFTILGMINLFLFLVLFELTDVEFKVLYLISLGIIFLLVDFKFL